MYAPDHMLGTGPRPPEYVHGFFSAAICRRGHVETATLERQKTVARKCVKCGSLVIASCPRCGAEIRGAPWPRKDLKQTKAGYQAPSFCSECGGLFPWASREAIIYHLEDELESEPDLDESERGKLSKQLQSLLEDGDGKNEKVQTAALRALRAAAPKAWSIAAPALMGIATAELRRELGLPPS
jgi:hypothetical protein